ncbi:MAG: galactokinase [Cyclobacteriaceae bacterium]
MTNRIQKEFRERFKTEPTTIVSPGRINLLGEHLDYNGGVVLPTAINKYITFAIGPVDSDHCTVVAADYGETISFSLDDLKPYQGWISYFMGVVQGIRNVERPHRGFNCVFGGDIPDGAGLSSSAALCCGIGFALNEIFSLKLKRIDIALIAQFAEHEFAGVKCGIMDQYANLFSQQNFLLQLDCRLLTHELVPFVLDDVEILLIDTRVKHELASSAYNDRRSACEWGVSQVKELFPDVTSLRDVQESQLRAIENKMTSAVFNNCLYVLQEMERVRVGVALLKANDLPGFGRLMYQSHQGLSAQYEVSCAELDYLVRMAADNNVLGSRMMGGGFGGCTINLVHKDKSHTFQAHVAEEYQQQFEVDPQFYCVEPGDGVRLLS